MVVIFQTQARIECTDNIDKLFERRVELMPLTHFEQIGQVNVARLVELFVAEVEHGLFTQRF